MTSHARLLLVMLGACGPSSLTPSVVAPTAPDLRDGRFVDVIAKVALAYKPWGRVDEAPNIAPALCRMPMREDYGEASHVRQSKAPEGPHGTKLYYLWTTHRDAYRVLPKLPIEDGFTSSRSRSPRPRWTRTLPQRPTWLNSPAGYRSPCAG